MKVKTYFVPDHCEYLTVGKGYDVIEENTSEIGKQFFIYDDKNDYIEILLSNCYHLGGFSWQIIEDSFDLKAYSFSDSDNMYAEVIDNNVCIMDSSGHHPTILSKKDAIAIAKALGVKGSDL